MTGRIVQTSLKFENDDKRRYLKNLSFAFAEWTIVQDLQIEGFIWNRSNTCTNQTSFCWLDLKCHPTQTLSIDRINKKTITNRIRFRSEQKLDVINNCQIYNWFFNSNFKSSNILLPTVEHELLISIWSSNRKQH